MLSIIQLLSCIHQPALHPRYLIICREWFLSWDIFSLSISIPWVIQTAGGQVILQLEQAEIRLALYQEVVVVPSGTKLPVIGSVINVNLRISLVEFNVKIAINRRPLIA